MGSAEQHFQMRKQWPGLRRVGAYKPAPAARSDRRYGPVPAARCGPQASATPRQRAAFFGTAGAAVAAGPARRLHHHPRSGHWAVVVVAAAEEAAAFDGGLGLEAAAAASGTGPRLSRLRALRGPDRPPGRRRSGGFTGRGGAGPTGRPPGRSGPTRCGRC